MIAAHGSVGRLARLRNLALVATSVLGGAILESRPVLASGITADPASAAPTTPRVNYIDQLGRVSSVPPTSGTYTAVTTTAPAPAMNYIDQLGRVSSVQPTSGSYIAVPATAPTPPTPAANYIDQFGRVSPVPPTSGTFTAVPTTTPTSFAPAANYVDQFGRVSPTPPTSGSYTVVPTDPTAPGWMPPVPASTGTSSPLARICDWDHSTAATPPAAALELATPTPEPASFLTALALTGAFITLRRAMARRPPRGQA